VAVRADELVWPQDGLLPVVIQDDESGRVLTVAYANREALERTLATGATYLYSRSRAALWRKGETSGHAQRVVDVSADCDGDALLYRVVPSGPACHTGAASCFADGVDHDEAFFRAVRRLRSTIEQRRTADPEHSYVARLLLGGVDRIGKKVGEEATEVVIAAKNAEPGELIHETADLFFHVLVLLAQRGVSLGEVGEELLSRSREATGSDPE